MGMRFQDDKTIPRTWSFRVFVFLCTPAVAWITLVSTLTGHGFDVFMNPKD